MRGYKKESVINNRFDFIQLQTSIPYFALFEKLRLRRGNPTKIADQCLLTAAVQNMKKIAIYNGGDKRNYIYAIIYR